MVYNVSKAYIQIRSRFSVRAKRKCINSSQVTVATSAVDSGNGLFQTSRQDAFRLLSEVIYRNLAYSLLFLS